MTEKYEKFHQNGALWARGQTDGDQQVGFWEFFRKDGSKLRSGTFDKGKQVGEWITYNRDGKPYKITKFPTALSQNQ
jgi:antitoxin component YwqK of YwqJK toxin-antitoxin module